MRWNSLYTIIGRVFMYDECNCRSCVIRLYKEEDNLYKVALLKDEEVLHQESFYSTNLSAARIRSLDIVREYAKAKVELWTQVFECVKKDV